MAGLMSIDWTSPDSQLHGADGWTLPEQHRDALLGAYQTPPRAYHHFGHVLEVLRHYHEVAAGPGWQEPREVYVAVLYHDAIYQPGRSDNEARSADLARQELADVPGLDLDRVCQLITLTARHGSLLPEEVDADAAHFLDCDMAILGAEPEAFDRYDAAIAEEYAGVVPGFIYRFKRRRFLASLLGRPRIYLSGFGHARWDAPARANLRRAAGKT
jgi:predicted metal-dependent HD superfamily phosphohydrolase